MESFLEKLAGYIYSNHKNDLLNTHVLLPNRRAGLFLKKHLAALSNEPVWSPVIQSIEDFIENCTQQKMPDTTALLFELYKTYLEIGGENKEPFDEFSRWGQLLLNDFNEIDSYCVNADDILKNLQEIKIIENWSLNENELTPFQTQYIAFYNTIRLLYQQFNKNLDAKNCTYPGKATKQTAENILNTIEKKGISTFIIAGFNALNKSEEQLFKKILSAKKGVIFWDADSYYYYNHVHEAGKFLRNNIPNFKENQSKEENWITNYYKTSRKNITIYGVPGHSGQAQLANSILKELNPDKENLPDTVLVLADESLLFPVIKTLPDNIATVNITMGVPVKNTPIFSLVESILEMHVNAEKMNASRNKKNKEFYHANVSQLLSHPYLRYSETNADAVNSLTNKINRNNIVFISESRVIKEIPDAPFIYGMFKHWNNAIECTDYLIQLTYDLREMFMSSDSNPVLEIEYLAEFKKMTERIRTLLNEYKISISIQTLYSLLKQLATTTKLPFYGEPLSGLQLMGILETRALNFKNVILLSANENILPSGKSVSSFIPFDLRRFFGLPLYHDKDAVFSYHFYRLLQNAENIHLVYNTEQDEFGKGEKSRFITQLQNELPRYNPNVSIQEKITTTKFNIAAQKNKISIVKSDELLNKTRALLEKKVSASALITYNTCSLKFYYNYLAEIKEPQEVEENIEADVLGNAIHETLEKLFTPLKGKKLTIQSLTETKKSIFTEIESFFNSKHPDTEITIGKNLLLVNAAVSYIENYLEFEIKRVAAQEKNNRTITILDLEKKIYYKFEKTPFPVTLYGIIDRVELSADDYSIIDYKTGQATASDVKIKDWNELKDNPKKSKLFQLLFYSYLFAKESNTKNTITPQIVSFRNLNEGSLMVSTPEKQSHIYENELTQFETIVTAILTSITNKNELFIQTDDVKSCEYCAYKALCNIYPI